MRKKIVIGNWKMHGSLNFINELLRDVQHNLPANLHDKCVVLPPSIYVPYVGQTLSNTNIQFGAQNIYPADCGAYTGEISGCMVKEFGCRYVLVGHSERRRYFCENENIISDKFHYVLLHDMIPILCVGETKEDRDQGKTESVIAAQLKVLQAQSVSGQFVVAYEPVWSIGTGVTPHPDEVQSVHAFIRACLANVNGINAQEISILYGGSVNDTNASAIFSMPDVDGGLIGAASLNAQKFVEILKCIK